MDTELIVRLLTDFRQEMNARFERLEGRMDKRFDAVDQRFEEVEYRMTQINLELTAQIATIARSLNEELIIGRRELRSRLDRCERELDELRRRDRD